MTAFAVVGDLRSKRRGAGCVRQAGRFIFTAPMSDYAHTPDTAFQATVRGYVQGVGFRYYTQREARRRGITGWVKNRADGSVEVLAEGAPEELDAFAAWLQEGPPGARVRDVEMHRPVPATGHLRFTVEY